MNKKIVLIVCILVILSSFAIAEDVQWPRENENTVFNRFSHFLGGGFGSVSGNGIIYQQWFDSLGLRGSFLIGLNPNIEESSFFMIDTLFLYEVGIEGMYQMYSVDFFEWFSNVIYLNLFLDHAGRVPRFNTSTGEYTVGEFEYGFTLGGGYGIEMVLFEHLSNYIDFGYHVSWNSAASSLPEQFLVNFYIKSGLGYRY
ncbi:MAG: hypothetical protein ACLFR1_15010 [Spirochaetia bacterium]